MHITDRFNDYYVNLPILETSKPQMVMGNTGMAFGAPYDETLGGALQVNGKVESTGVNYVYTFQGNLPSGDGTNAYWQSIKPGIYWVGSAVTISGGSGKPTDYAMVSIMKSGQEVTVMWYRHETGPFYKMSMNANSVLTNRSWAVIHGAVTLYNDATGTTGTVTLSETASAFSYLEVFYGNSNKTGCASAKVYSPNGKGVDMATHNFANGILIISQTRATIAGTTITPMGTSYCEIKTNNVFLQALNTIHIYRVVGYR